MWPRIPIDHEMNNNRITHLSGEISNHIHSEVWMLIRGEIFVIKDSARYDA